jgi:hypothetical protein
LASTGEVISTVGDIVTTILDVVSTIAGSRSVCSAGSGRKLAYARTISDCRSSGYSRSSGKLTRSRRSILQEI